MSSTVVQDSVVSYFITMGLDEFMGAVGGPGSESMSGKLNEIIDMLGRIADGQKHMNNLLQAISTQIEISKATGRTDAIESRITDWIRRLKNLSGDVKSSAGGKTEEAALIQEIKTYCAADVGVYHDDLTTSGGFAGNGGNSKPVITLWLDGALKALVNQNGYGTLQELYYTTVPNYLKLLAEIQRNGVMFLGIVNKADDAFYLKYRQIVEDNIVAQRELAYEHYACKSFENLVQTVRHGPIKIVSATTSTPDVLTSSINEKRETGIRLSNPSDIRDNYTWRLEIVEYLYSKSGGSDETCSIWSVRMIYDTTNTGCAKFIVRRVTGFDYNTAHENTIHDGDNIKVTLRFLPYGVGGTGRFPYQVYEVYDSNVPRLFTGFEWCDPNGAYHLEQTPF